MNTPLCFMLDCMLIRFFLFFVQISLFPIIDNLVNKHEEEKKREKQNCIGYRHGKKVF